MLIETLLVLSYWGIILFADIVDEDNSVVGSTGDQIRVLNTELASSYLAL